MSGKMKRRLPAGWTGIPAALCALLMVLCLLGAGCGLLAVQVTGDRELHARGALKPEALDAQMVRIDEEIRALAAEEGFAAEDLLPLIDRAGVEQMDREFIAWWTYFAVTGKLGEEPSYPMEKGVEALQKDEAWMAGVNSMMAESRAREIVNRAEKKVIRSGMLFRDFMLKAADRFAGSRINLPRVTRLIRQLPGLCGAAAFLLAGLIALLRSRRIQTAGQYIGGALSAAGLLALLGLGLIKALNIRGMIAEASAQLESQYAALAQTLTWETLGAAAALLILGGLCIALARKEYR